MRLDPELDDLVNHNQYHHNGDGSPCILLFQITKFSLVYNY